MVFEDMLETDDVGVTERFVDLDFCYELNKERNTFCLALDLLRVLLAIIFAADIFFVSKLVT